MLIWNVVYYKNVTIVILVSLEKNNDVHSGPFVVRQCGSLPGFRKSNWLELDG